MSDIRGNTENNLNSEAKPKTPAKNIIFIAVSALIVVIVAAIFVFRGVSQKRSEEEALRQEIINYTEFLPGVEVDNIPLDGLTVEEAEKLINDANKQELNKIQFNLTLDGEITAATAEVYNPVFNTKAILSEAFSVCREGTLEELRAEMEDIASNKRQYFTDYTADESAVAAFVDELSQKFDQPPTDAGFTVLIDNSNVSEQEKKTEQYITLAATTTPEQRFIYTEHEDGITIDKEALKATLLDMAEQKSYHDVEIPMHVTPADITIDNIQEHVVLRATAFTSFAKSPYNRDTRVFNIKKCASIINGTVIMPGEQFSANTVLGDRTYAAGWKEAPAIVQGRTEDQAGGGVCQVSTTLYICVLKADLEVVYRQGHSGRLGYITGGLDATIDSGRIDFVWRNNTNSPIYLFAYVDEKEKTINFDMYGEPFPDEYDKIEVSSERISTIEPPGEMEYQIDPTKPYGFSEVYVERKSGSVWQSYATYLKDGKVVKKVNIDTTKYNAYSGITIVGPDYYPETTVTDENNVRVPLN